MKVNEKFELRTNTIQIRTFFGLKCLSHHPKQHSPLSSLTKGPRNANLGKALVGALDP